MVVSSDVPVGATAELKTKEPVVETEKPSDNVTAASQEPQEPHKPADQGPRPESVSGPTPMTALVAGTATAPAIEDTSEATKEKPAPPPLKTTASQPVVVPVQVATTTQTAVNGGTPAIVSATVDDGVNPIDFQGTVDTNNDLPTAETLRKIENYVVLDRHGKTHTFKSLYSGKHVARRVLIIFVRHFFCGLCQDYLRVLAASITPEALLRLPISTFIAVIGCGDPGLIDMYASATDCPFPIYADPTRKLYDELGMIKTLSMGTRPAYAQKHILKSSIASVFQGLKQIGTGKVTKAGDQRQIGGEFLFEPYDIQSPVVTPWSDSENRRLEMTADGNHSKHSDSLDGLDDSSGSEEKRVTWCHRMKNTRDHAEVPEIMEVLGLDGQGLPSDDKKRWSKAIEERKGTGLSMARQMSLLNS